MNFPRRPTPSIVRPVIESMNTSGSGCLTIDGNRSSQRSIVRPTRCGLRSATMVSTSGSSGTDDRELLHIGPVGADLRLDLDARLELVRARHDAWHLLGELVELRARHLE